MKIINRLLYMMAFVGVLGFAACEDDVDYNPAAPVDGSKTLAFFDSNAPF